ncbi:DNA polymerase nu isoform X1 [Gadus morhua]|uniref:DNA polymerase nu isoform X1 n=1 Tax=Gadus morhua TaxID=8049 RepID=UPI0011B5C1CB|nr:DNA polymerase nu isoform X1 [Gadus morhua]
MEGYGGLSRSLCFGPLSQPAERILAALRAQALPPPRNRSNHRYSRQVDEGYGTQREHLVQAGWNTTQHRMQGRETERPGSQTQPYSSSSWPRTPSYSSAATSWDSSQQTDHSQNPDSFGSTSSKTRPCLPSKDYNQLLSQSDSRLRNLPYASHTLSSPQRAVVLPAPGGSQSNGWSLHRPGLPAQQDTSPWKSLSEEPETFFTLSLPPEGPDLDAFYPDLHLQKPTPSSVNVRQVSEYCLPDVQNKVQPREIGAREWDGCQDDHYLQNVPPKNQHKVCLPRLDHVKVVSTGGGNGKAWYEGPGSALLKPWKQLSLPQGKTGPETGFDRRQLYEPLNVNRNCGAGLMVDFVAAMDVDRGEEEPENQSQVLSEVNHIRSKCSNGGREQEAFRENHGLSRMKGKQFPIAITDEMDTASDFDVDGRALRQTEHQDVGEGFPHEPGARDEEITTGGSSRSITPELTPVLLEESVNTMVTQGAQTTQKTSELETAGDKEEGPQRPEEQRESSNRELSPGGAPLPDGPDTAVRDEEDAATAAVVLETDAGTVQGGTTQAEEQMGGDQGGRTHPVQVEEEEEEVEEEEEEAGPSERGMVLQEMLEDENEPLLKTSNEVNGSPALEGSPVERQRPPLRLSQEGGATGSGFRVPPLLHGNAPLEATLHTCDTLQSQQPLLSATECVDPPPVTRPTPGPNLRSDTGPFRGSSDISQFGPALPKPSRIPAFSIKRKREEQNAGLTETPRTSQPRRPVKWEPPRSSQGRTGGDGGDRRANRDREADENETGAPTRSCPSKDLGLCPPALAQVRQARARSVHPATACLAGGSRTDGPMWKQHTMRPHQHIAGAGGSPLTHCEMNTSHGGVADTASASIASAAVSTAPKKKRARQGPGKITSRGAASAQKDAIRGERPADQAAGVTSDPRVKDAGRMSLEERAWLLRRVGGARATALTMVFQDGSTQFDPEQNPSPPVCGLLVLMRQEMDHSGPGAHLHPGDTCFYLRLEHAPAWAQRHEQHSQESFTRETLVQVVSGAGLLVCYKAKDLLRTALQHYRPQISWKQVLGCRIQDPQVSGWLLDPADPATCYQDLIKKHLRPSPPQPAPGTSKASQAITGLNLLYRLNMELCAKLQSQGLWQLYSTLELSMIPVLAAMESYRIHVDREALKTTSDMLGTKMKQLEQEAHQAAGQIFLVTSSTQLRTVLFDKLRLHERCENKKLPKTINKQQQSTSEAALLQLRDLHPLPKIILEYRQVHKIKSTFVDGFLSCMMGKSYISSTWLQTSAVTGRISAKHPNFQALPRQPVHITKKQYIQGKDAEVVKVHPRNMFIPQEGWTFLAADFCQVELRLLAHLSGDPELLRVFSHAHSDVFTMLASRWKGVRESEVSSEEREHAKRIVYSVVYGAGRERLSGILGVSSEQASRFQDSFLQTYREVQTFIQTTVQQCHQQGYVVSIMGRRRALPLIHSADWGVRMQAERQAVNFVVQGSAADLCKMAMIRISSQVCSSSSLSARLLAQLHDELLYEVEDSQVEQFAGLVKGTMEALQHIDSLRVHLKVPLKVALSSGKSWGSMSELSLCAAPPPTPPASTPPP